MKKLVKISNEELKPLAIQLFLTIVNDIGIIPNCYHHKYDGNEIKLSKTVFSFYVDGSSNEQIYIINSELYNSIYLYPSENNPINSIRVSLCEYMSNSKNLFLQKSCEDPNSYYFDCYNNNFLFSLDKDNNNSRCNGIVYELKKLTDKYKTQEKLKQLTQKNIILNSNAPVDVKRDLFEMLNLNKK